MAAKKYVQSQTLYLAGSGVLIGATTITLTSLTDIYGNAITSIAAFGDKGYITLEPDTSNEEGATFTSVTSNANGTTTLGGISTILAQSPYTETSGLIRQHNGGTKVVITDNVAFWAGFGNKNNDEALIGRWTTPVAPLNPNDLVNKAYADALAIAGAPNASTTTKGIGTVSVAPTSPTSPIFVGDNDPRISPNSYVVDTGAANAYVVTLPVAPAAYVAGQVFSFKAANANTTASTLNVNALGIKNLFLSHNNATPAALVGGEIKVGQIIQVEYDGTQFQIVSNTAATATIADVTTIIAAGFSTLSAPFTAASALAAGPVALGSYSSDGGIGFDLVTSGSLSGGNVTVTVGNHSNRKLYFMLPQIQTGLPGITDNGVAMTQIVNTTSWGAGGNINTAIYELVNPSIGSNLIVTGLTTQSYIIYSLYNCVQSAATVFSSAQAASASSVSTSLTPDTIGSIILTVVGASVGPTLTSALYNQTAPTNSRSGNMPPALAVVSNAVSATFGSSNYAGICALSVKPFVTGTLGVIPASSGILSYIFTSCFGFVNTSYALGATASVVLNGIVTGLSGLTIGSVYYLNDTAGTIGTSPGTNTRKLGIALSATTLYITNEP